jgi:PKD repeat protein/uncharacterized protein YjiK
MAFDGRANRLLIFQSPGDRLVEILARPDGSLDPQTLERIDARSFGVQNPQGMTVDPVSGHLLILDAAGPRIVRVEPHARVGFESPTVSEVDLADTGLDRVRGLALDPTDGHLHVFDPAAQALHELTERGRIVATRDLSAFGFRSPSGMVFAPSGDNTDDPSEMSLYIADSGVDATTTLGGGSSFAETGHITELSLAQPRYFASGGAGAEPGTLVQIVDTWQFDPPSPDAAGITYLGHVGDLLISDSEVNEMPIYAGANLFQMSLSGVLAETYTTISYSGEPTGITWNPSNNHLFISDDTGERSVYEVDPGADGLYETADDVVTSFVTELFGSNDPEGVTFDSSQGVLFVADGVNAEIYRVSPGSNGIFDGVPPAGDDAVTSFDTKSLGLNDPEGVAYDTDYGHLYIVGKPATQVFHVTTTGTLLRTIDISAANPDKPAGLGYAPSSENPGEMTLWIVDRGVDNNSDPKENDGRAYEFSLPSSSGNAIPTVTITAPPGGSTYDEGTSVAFEGSASDAENGNLTANLAWISNLDGAIGAGGSFSTNTLSVGTHTVTASVTDGGGQQGSSAVTVTVNPEGVVTLDVRVSASTDDAEESSSGGVSLGSSDLELVNSGSDQTVGIRFNGVTIPQGATITNATIQFQTDEATTGATSLTIEGEAADHAATFASTNGNISTRNRTANSVAWSPAQWPTVGQAGPDQSTPNIASVLQEIVNRGGWSSGNSLAIIITGTGERTAEAFDGVPSGAPSLHVDYSVADPGVNQEPTASFTFTTTDLQAFFTDTSTDPDGTVVSWSWDFGDGTGTSVLKNPSYTYASAGTYPVSLTVTDNEGAANTTTQNVSVTDPVVVTGIVPASLAAGSSIEVTITGSGFIPGATLTFEGGSGPSPSASNVIVAANGITITATITAKAGGPRRNRVWDVRVVNPDGGSGVLPGGLTITNSR